MKADLVKKRCGCPEARWPKCEPHPWYLKEMQVRGETYAPNLTRHAAIVMNRVITAKGDAQAVAEIVRGEILAGTYVAAKDYRPPTLRVPGQTLDTVAEKFALAHIDADMEKSANSKTNDRAVLKRLCHARVNGERLGTQPMDLITLDDLIAFRGLQTHLAASTWNKIRTVLGQLWAWARWQEHIERDVLVDSPRPALKLLRRGKQNKRSRRISETEWANLLAAAVEMRVEADGPRMMGLLIALMETGARIGELLALQWGDVHREEKYLLIRAEEVGARKTGDGRIVNISDVLEEVLAKRERDPAGQRFKRNDYVFGNACGERVQSIDKAWRTIVLRANNREPVWDSQSNDFDAASRDALQAIDLHVHDIRHEAACRWLESRAWDLDEIRIRLGHTTIAQTATYLHVDKGNTRGAQQRYDAHRKAAAAAAAQQAQAAAGGETPHKLRTNVKTQFRPRLIKSDKS